MSWFFIGYPRKDFEVIQELKSSIYVSQFILHLIFIRCRQKDFTIYPNKQETIKEVLARKGKGKNVGLFAPRGIRTLGARLCTRSRMAPLC
jgi:hypothetical protein